MPRLQKGGPRGPAASTPAYAPMSPKELVRVAEMFEWRPQIPLKFHIGSLDAMYREVSRQERGGRERSCCLGRLLM